MIDFIFFLQKEKFSLNEVARQPLMKQYKHSERIVNSSTKSNVKNTEVITRKQKIIRFENFHFIFLFRSNQVNLNASLDRKAKHSELKSFQRLKFPKLQKENWKQSVTISKEEKDESQMNLQPS